MKFDITKVSNGFILHESCDFSSAKKISVFTSLIELKMYLHNLLDNTWEEKCKD